MSEASTGEWTLVPKLRQNMLPVGVGVGVGACKCVTLVPKLRQNMLPSGGCACVCVCVCECSLQVTVYGCIRAWVHACAFVCV